MDLIKNNKTASFIVGIAALIAATLGIIEGVQKLDSFICSEAEAQEMIQQQAIPVQRDQLEFQIDQMKREIFVLKQKAQYNKEEPWEAELLKEMQKELGELEIKKDNLD